MQKKIQTGTCRALSGVIAWEWPVAPLRVFWHELTVSEDVLPTERCEKTFFLLTRFLILITLSFKSKKTEWATDLGKSSRSWLKRYQISILYKKAIVYFGMPDSLSSVRQHVCTWSNNQRVSERHMYTSNYTPFCQCRGGQTALLTLSLFRMPASCKILPWSRHCVCTCMNRGWELMLDLLTLSHSSFVESLRGAPQSILTF